MKRVVSVIALLLVAAVSLGCGTVKTDEGSVSVKNGQIQAKGADGSSITVSENGSVQVTSSDGTQTVKVGKTVPDGYPKDVLPVMSGANIIEGWQSGNMYSVKFETKASAQEAMKFYENALKDKPGYSFTDLTKDNKPGYGLMVIGDDGTLTALIEVNTIGTTVVELSITR